MNLAQVNLNQTTNKKILYGFFYFFLVQPLTVWISTFLIAFNLNNNEIYLIFFGIFYLSGQFVSIFLYSYVHWLFRKTNQEYYWKYSWLVLPWNVFLDFVFFYQVIIIYRLINKIGFKDQQFKTTNNLFVYQALTSLIFIISALSLYLPLGLLLPQHIVIIVALFFPNHLFIKIIINQIIDLIILKEQLKLNKIQKVFLVIFTILGQPWFALAIKNQTFKTVESDQDSYRPSWSKK